MRKLGKPQKRNGSYDKEVQRPSAAHERRRKEKERPVGGAYQNNQMIELSK